MNKVSIMAESTIIHNIYQHAKLYLNLIDFNFKDDLSSNNYYYSFIKFYNRSISSDL